jgi:hypothetical protein
MCTSFRLVSANSVLDVWFRFEEDGRQLTKRVTWTRSLQEAVLKDEAEATAQRARLLNEQNPLGTVRNRKIALR